MEQWKGFAPGVWQDEINVRNFIQKNYTQYTGDDSFLQPPTEKTKKVWGKCEDLLRQEMKNGGVLDVETKIISGIDNLCPRLYRQGKRGRLSACRPTRRSSASSISTAACAWQSSSLEQYGYAAGSQPSKTHVSEYRKTHNEGVFDALHPSARA